MHDGTHLTPAQEFAGMLLRAAYLLDPKTPEELASELESMPAEERDLVLAYVRGLRDAEKMPE